MRHNGDVISGAVLTGLGIYVVVEARHWDYLAPEGPGPGFFPVWYGVALIALAIVVMVSAWRRAPGEREPIRWSEVRRALGAWAAFALSIGLLKVLGFLASFALLTFFVVCVMYRRPIGHGIAAAAAGSLIFYLLFPFALNVALPVNSFGF